MVEEEAKEERLGPARVKERGENEEKSSLFTKLEKGSSTRAPLHQRNVW